MIDIDKDKFVELFLQECGSYMYEYIDPYEYGLGMEQISDEKVKEIAEGFYEEILLTKNKIREEKLKRII